MRFLFLVALVGVAGAVVGLDAGCGGRQAANRAPADAGVDGDDDAAAPADAPVPALACAAPYDVTSDDPHNCGAPGRDCLGATCTAGICAPQVVVTPAQLDMLSGDGGVAQSTALSSLAVDDQNLYVAAGASVYGLPKTGGDVFTVAAAAVAASNAGGASLVLSGGTLYWAFAVEDDNGETTDSILSASTSSRGATGTLLFSTTFPTNGVHLMPGGASLVGVLGQTIYWADACLDLLSLPTTGGSTLDPVYLPCVPLVDGGPPVVSDVFGPVVLDPVSQSAFVRFAPEPEAPGTVEQIHLPGGAAAMLPGLPTPPVLPQHSPYGADGEFEFANWLGVANGSVYLTTLATAPNALFSLPTNGSGPWTFVATQPCSPISVTGRLTLDGSHAYMVDPTDANSPVDTTAYARVVRLDLETGSAVQIYSELAPPKDRPAVPPEAWVAAIDDQYIYIGSALGIVRVAK